MKPGDLVKFLPMKGFSWWAGKTFVILRFDDHPGWVTLLTAEGEQIHVNTGLLEALQ